MKKLILASGSPRRKEILEKIGYKFDVQPSEFEENMNQELSPEELAKNLSHGKAKEIADKNKYAIVFGADTFVYFNGKIVGKPKDKAEAIEMLSMLSGKVHEVYTGFTIIDTDSGKWVSKVECTKVYFRKLDGDKIYSN
jgi:septum formation protein